MVRGDLENNTGRWGFFGCLFCLVPALFFLSNVTGALLFKLQTVSSLPCLEDDSIFASSVSSLLGGNLCLPRGGFETRTTFTLRIFDNGTRTQISEMGPPV